MLWIFVVVKTCSTWLGGWTRQLQEQNFNGRWVPRIYQRLEEWGSSKGVWCFISLVALSPFVIPWFPSFVSSIQSCLDCCVKWLNIRIQSIMTIFHRHFINAHLVITHRFGADSLPFAFAYVMLCSDQGFNQIAWLAQPSSPSVLCSFLNCITCERGFHYCL